MNDDSDLDISLKEGAESFVELQIKSVIQFTPKIKLS